MAGFHRPYCFYQPWPGTKVQVLHLLFHKITSLELHTEMVVADGKKVSEQEDMILLGIGTRTHIINVFLHLFTARVRHFNKNRRLSI